MTPKRCWPRSRGPACSRLEPAPEAWSGPALVVGGWLGVGGLTAVQLTAAGAFEAAVSVFEVVIGHCDADDLERTLLAADAGEAHAAKLEVMRQRIGEGVADGTLRLLPPRPDEDGSRSLIDSQLVDLLGAPPLPDGVLLVADRNLTGFHQSGTHTVVGFDDLVAAMVRDGAITSSRAEAIRMRSIGTGSVFVEVSGRTVVAALLSAPVLKGVVVETADLAALRRHGATSRRLDRHLKIGPATGPLAARPGEDLAARAAMRLFSEALIMLGTEEPASFGDLHARSDWLWQAFGATRIDRPSPVADGDGHRRMFETLQVAHLFDRAFDVGGIADRRRSVRLAYLN